MKQNRFLVAALVIIAVVASLATVYNNVKVSQQDVSVCDLSKNIKYEGLQYLASKSYYASNPQEIQSYLETLVRSYANTNTNTDMIIIYGNLTTVQAIEYNSTNRGGVSFGGSGQSIETPEIKYISNIPVNFSAGSATIILGSEAYSFDINEQGQNFFLVFLKKENYQGDIFAANNLNSPCGIGKSGL